MQRSSGLRLFPLFLTIVIVIVIIIAIVSIGRAIFSGTQQKAPEADVGQTELLNTSIDHSVQMIIRGPIVAEENFKSFTISVSPTSRSMVVYQGYVDEISRSKRLSNNTAAYEQFAYALDKANMTKGTETSNDTEKDLRGVCASGYVYEYSVLVNGQPVKHLWTSSCNGSKGTLEASTTQLDNLFYAQIPDSAQLNPFRSTGVDLLKL